MDAFLEYIEQHENQFVEELQSIVQQPSISAQSIGMSETAEKITDYMRSIGITTKIYSVENGHPIIFGEIKGESEKSILFYNHYDVQPPEPLELWKTPPFDAVIQDGKIFGRGVADNKGALMSRLQAVATIMAVEGKLPVTIKFLVEGEEEIGSPNFKTFVDAHREMLRSDLCIWENSYSDEEGNPSIRLGNKGMCYVELSAESMIIDTHSKNATIYPNAAWELVWALSTLKDRNENVLIEGFYDAVIEPEQEEIEVIKKVPINEERIKARAGVENLVRNVTGYEIANAMYNFPTCTICGINSGYTGKGQKTVLPAKATAKVDMRLVPNQDPDDIYEKLIVHLKKHGFGNIKVKRLSECIPSKTPVTAPYINLIYETGVLAYDRKPIIEPLSIGTGPRYVFSRWTDMPIVALGVSNAASQSHAPNENIYIHDYIAGIKHIVLLISKFSL